MHIRWERETVWVEVDVWIGDDFVVDGVCWDEGWWWSFIYVVIVVHFFDGGLVECFFDEALSITDTWGLVSE